MKLLRAWQKSDERTGVTHIVFGGPVFGRPATPQRFDRGEYSIPASRPAARPAARSCKVTCTIVLVLEILKPFLLAGKIYACAHGAGTWAICQCGRSKWNFPLIGQAQRRCPRSRDCRDLLLEASCPRGDLPPSPALAVRSSDRHRPTGRPLPLVAGGNSVCVVRTPNADAKRDINGGF